MICNRAMQEFDVPENYHLVINPHVKDLFLKTDQQCDCDECKAGVPTRARR